MDAGRVTGRLRVADPLRDSSLPELHHVLPELKRAVVDAVFDKQVTDGGLRRALDELPKYIKAFQRTKKRDSPGRAHPGRRRDVPDRAGEKRSRIPPSG